MKVPLWLVIVSCDGQPLRDLQVRAFSEDSAIGKAKWVFQSAVSSAGPLKFCARKLED